MKDYMKKAEEYMEKHDFLPADKVKVRNWIHQHHSDKICDVSITRELIIIKNVFGSTCSIHRLALGIQENFV